MRIKKNFKSKASFQTKLSVPYTALIVGCTFILFLLLEINNILLKKTIDTFSLFLLLFILAAIVLCTMIFRSIYKQILITDEEIIVKWYFIPKTVRYALDEVKGFELYQVAAHDD